MRASVLPVAVLIATACGSKTSARSRWPRPSAIRILVAFGEVENSLAGIHHLSTQAGAQNRAVANSRRAVELATERYRSGLVSYLEIVDASRDALQTERGSAQIAGQRLVTAVQLIKALGGGWNEQQLFATTQTATNR